MTSPILRLAAPKDFATIAAITNHYIRTTAIHFGAEDVTRDELHALWHAHEDLYPWLVSEIAGEVVAYAKAGTYRARAAYRWTTEIGIYVAHTRCGQGLGRPLYSRLCAVLRAQGFHSAIGGIALPNAASVRLHEQLGFEHCGTVRRAGRKFDRWHDVGFWQLALQSPDDAPGPLATPADGFART